MSLIINPTYPKLKFPSILKGCVLHMSLDQESYNPATRRLTDKSGYGNHGTSSTPATFVPDRMGQTGRAKDFSGVGDYVVMNDHITNGEYTISVWFNSTNTGHLGLFAFANTSWFNFNFAGNGRPLLYLSPSNYRYFNDIGGYIDGEWHLLSIYIPGAAQSDISNTVLRMDGEIITGLVARATSAQTAFTYLRLGYGSAGGGHFDGAMNDIWIHNRALTESERTYLYESYRPKLMVGP